jgi:hypothetical protein
MDAVADKIALIFANDEPYEVLTDKAGGKVITRAANQAPFDDTRRDDLGTTHHDAGTMRMGDDIADAVTNDFGRIHDTTNCYVAGPALFPSIGSPNPMLTGVALAKRTGDLLNGDVLPKPTPFVFAPDELADNQAAEAAGKPLPWRALFDGMAATFGRWRLAGPGGGGMLHLNGEMVSYGTGGLRLFYYATEQFGEVQIDDNARPSGLRKHRTGAIYNIPADDPGEPQWQTFTPGPTLTPAAWFEYEVIVKNNDYTVFLTNTQTGERKQTTSFHNTDGPRGASPGFIGLQVYAGSTVAWRHIRIKS